MSLKKKISLFQRFDVKITVLYSSIFFLLALLQSSFLYYRLEHNFLKQVGNMLADEADELIDEIHDEYMLNQAGNKISDEADGRIDKIYDEPLTGNGLLDGCLLFDQDTSKRNYFPIYFRVASPRGEKIYQSKNSLHIAFPAWEERPDFDSSRMKVQGSLLIREEHLYLPALERKILVQICTNSRRIDKLTSNFLENIYIAIPILMLLCIGGGVLVSRKPRKTIRNITRVTRNITSRNLRERLHVPEVQDEISDLTVTINSMMDRLETSFHEIKQFTSDVSHELRNPLFALKGEIEVALSQKRNEYEYRESMQVCLERINVLIKMVNDLFLITRFDSNKVALEFEYVNLWDIARDMYEFFLPMAQEKKIDFSMGECEEIVIRADRVKLFQVFNNLLDNAVKFTPENGAIRIALGRSRDDGVELSVCDTGVGIPKDRLGKIFDRFYQVDPARSWTESGSGLGLHICKKIVEAHGGRIVAEQNQDQGACFRVYLPATDEDVERP
ncbi:MAG: HAMP domain-containing protein [Desulfobacteraceae bacterium]|nr:HAMP domain-containing protein [Desulfobacteraceae bacterium]